MRACRGSIALALSLALVGPVAAQQTGRLTVITALPTPGNCDARWNNAQLLLLSKQGAPQRMLDTDAEGTAVAEVAAGEYEVVLPDSLLSNRHCVTWRVPVTVTPGGHATVAFTMENATLLGREMAAPPPEKIHAALPLLESHLASLAYVSVGPHAGTAVLVEPRGLLVTASWIVDHDSTLIVELDDSVRVYGRVVLRDLARGLAAIRVPVAVVEGRPLLSLDRGVTPDTGLWLALGGRAPGGWKAWSAARVAGTAGGLRVEIPMRGYFAGALLMLDDGSPVGIVTDAIITSCGPKAPNVATLRDVAEVANLASQRLAALPPLADIRLPPWPKAQFTPAQLNAVADASNVQKYEPARPFELQHFTVWLQTPPLTLVLQRAADGVERREIDEKAGKAQGITKACYDSLERPPIRRTAEINEAAVFGVHVDDKLDEKQALKLYQGALQPGSKVVAGDLGSLTLYRNGTPVDPLLGGRDAHAAPFYVKKAKWDSKVRWDDSVHIGHYFYPGDVLAPDDNGAPPSLVLYVTDLRHPGMPSCGAIDPRALAVLWNDFEGVYPDRPFVRADPKKKPAGKRPDTEEVCRLAAARR